MRSVSVARRPVLTAGVVILVLVAAGVALLAESRVRLPIRYPGHRAFYGALALGLLSRTPRALLVGFGAALGAAVAGLAGNALLAVMWIAPAGLLALARPRSRLAGAALVLAAGVGFGLLRFLALPGLVHHTPEAIRLAGHLGFGALGASLAAGTRALAERPS